MSVGVRRLAVLGEFKPFGLIAEALDGKPADNFTDKYDYFLFDPELTRDRDEADDFDASSDALSDRSDHELFIRGNRWSFLNFCLIVKKLNIYMYICTHYVSNAVLYFVPDLSLDIIA